MKQKLSEICNGITDGSHNPPVGIGKSDFMMLSSKNIFNDEITLEDPRYLSEEQYAAENKRTKIKKGDVLITIVGTVGRVAVVNEHTPPITLQRSVAVLHPRKEICLSRYLMYTLRAKRAFFESEARGVAQKGIYLRQLSSITVDIPDKKEQVEVVQILDHVQSIICKRLKELRYFDDLIRARFVEMFGNPVLNDRGWPQKSLIELTTKIGSGATPKGGKEAYQDDGITLIRSMNVHNGQFEYKDLAHISDEQASKLDGVTVEKKDVLLNITGASVARCCIVPDEVLPARVNQHVCIVRCIDHVSPEFLNYLLIDDNYQDLLWSVAGSGATREAITKQQVESLQIILPPDELQRAFMTFVVQVDKSKDRSKRLTAA